MRVILGCEFGLQSLNRLAGMTREAEIAAEIRSAEIQARVDAESARCEALGLAHIRRAIYLLTIAAGQREREEWGAAIATLDLVADENRAARRIFEAEARAA